MDNYIPPRRRARRSPRQRHLPAQIRRPETVWKRRCCAPARRTLQSGAWILFQGEVKFLTGGDPAEGPCRDARRSACGGPSHGRQSATPRLSAAAIDAGPVLDGRARSAEIRGLTPVGTRDQRSQSGWKRQRSARKRERAAACWRWTPAGANRHGTAATRGICGPHEPVWKGIRTGSFSFAGRKMRPP